MSDDSQLDAESASRNRRATAEDHLKHLLRIGHAKTSPIVKKFVSVHNLEHLLNKL